MTFGQRYLTIAAIYCPPCSEMGCSRWAGTSLTSERTAYGHIIAKWVGNCAEIAHCAKFLEAHTDVHCSRIREDP